MFDNKYTTLPDLATALSESSLPFHHPIMKDARAFLWVLFTFDDAVEKFKETIDNEGVRLIG